MRISRFARGTPSSRLKHFELCREMTENRRFLDDPKPSQLLSLCVDLVDDLDDVIDVTLSVDAPWNGKSDQLHRW